MPDGPPGEITELLIEWRGGSREALERLMPLVYEQLKGVAGRSLARERPGHVLQPTALVHETYLKLIDQKRTSWKNRAHFFAIAARMMRRILIDQARRRQADKRGGQAVTLALEEAMGVPGEKPREVDVLDLDQALKALTELDPRQGQVVELRFFGGLTLKETAEVLELSVATVKVDWRMARSWLFRELSASPAIGSL
ncbi:MAG: sigma-70 family RNA polymerase sigma factor [Acidobacteriota bacterium]|nr:sigma-70 family RNA polymerase sigma factor [Acidobacteriota bacterium]